MLHNLAYLRETTEGNAALEAELLMHFTQTIHRCLAALENTNADWPNILHELKGAARSMGADTLADACDSAERTAMNAPEKSAYCVKMQTIAAQTLHIMQHHFAV